MALGPSRALLGEADSSLVVLCCGIRASRGQLAPSTIGATAAAEGTSALMQHLAEGLPELATPPPGKWRSRLLRWRSEERKERWKGVVDVLRTQSQVSLELSQAAGPRRCSRAVGDRAVVVWLQGARLWKGGFAADLLQISGGFYVSPLTFLFRGGGGRGRRLCLL